MFDLLNPLLLFDRLRRAGRGALLTWPRGAHTGAQVESFLRSYGVRILDRKVSGDEHGVWVSDKQAKYADGLLRGAGFAITSAPLSKPIAPRHRWGRAAKSVGIVGAIGDMWGVGDMAEDLARQNARKERRQRREKRNARR
jgi:hypothetical protein